MYITGHSAAARQGRIRLTYIIGACQRDESASVEVKGAYVRDEGRPEGVYISLAFCKLFLAQFSHNSNFNLINNFIYTFYLYIIAHFLLLVKFSRNSNFNLYL